MKVKQMSETREARRERLEDEGRQIQEDKERRHFKASLSALICPIATRPYKTGYAGNDVGRTGGRFMETVEEK